MANTTNFNWETPDDTDLVKDGAAAIRTLGNSIDTSFVDLKGGTTGQILSKASNTDLDYTWIANDQGDITEVQAGVGISVSSGTGPIPVITNSSTDLITTAGDLLYGTAADTVARLGIGTAGQVLKVNSGATAPEWGAVTFSPTWTSYTPTVTASTGTITSTTSTGQYLQIGKMMIVAVDVNITNAGTGSANLRITVPVNIVNGNVTGRFAGYGTETAATGKALQVATDAVAAATYFSCRFYDFVTCIATGNRISATVIYEVA